MKQYANKMGLALCVAAVCLMCCLISFSAGENTETEEIQRLTSLEDMRHELSHIQMFSLPTGLDRVVVDGGTYLFEPTPGDLEAPMFFSLLIPQEAEGLRCWPVTLFEDPESRDTVVLNAEGSEAVRLPCDPDYNPEWAFDMLFPLSPDITDADAYNPARIALSMRLVFREDGLANKESARPSPSKLEICAPSVKGSQVSPRVSPMELPASMLSTKQATADGCIGASRSASAVHVMALAYPSVTTAPDSDGDGLSDSAELSMGKAVAWGLNTYGRCIVPTSISNVIVVAGGYYHNLALRRNGMPVAWGQNTYGQCTIPASVTNVVAIAAGAYHNLAVRKSGSVVAWGLNTFGQCTIPASATNAVIASAGMFHSAVLRANGSVVAWGQNTYGQCTVPASATNIVAMAAGHYHTLAARGNRTIVAWGQNTYGQCTVPVSATNVVSVAAGACHSLALRTDGTVVAWGQNTYGQCTVPVAATNAVAIAAGQYHSFALRRDGRIIAWGQDTYRQCSGASNITYAVSIASGLSHGLAIRRPDPLNSDTDGDGMSDGWEINNGFDPLNAADAGQDTDGDSIINRSEFLNRTNPRNADTDGDSLPDAWELAYGLDPLSPDDPASDGDGDGQSAWAEYLQGTNPKAADTDGDGLSDRIELRLGKVMAWGTNTYGQCAVPASISNVIAVAAGASHSLALQSDGTLVAWGTNTYGQCTIPVSATNSVAVAAGAYHNLALRKSGSVVAWGQNTSGQCTVPASATNGVMVSAGMYHSAVLRANGSVVAWGQNTYGQCTVPTSVTNIVAMVAGHYHTLAARGNRTIVAWGQNTYGQCTVPASATNVVSVAAGACHSLALRADGTVVAWGQNTYGQCTVPASAANAVAVAAGQYHSFALRRDGRVIAWGQDTYRQCSGASNITFAVSIASGLNHGLAIRRPDPLNSDTDGDNMSDGWEVNNGLDPLNATDASQDADGDGIINRSEFLNRTDPRNADTDSDGMPDAWELACGLDPLNPVDATADADGDEFSNVYEYFGKSSLTNALSIPKPSIYVDDSAPAGGDGTSQKPFTTIRAALLVATNYVIIQVADGVYTGEGNRNLSFMGKPLMLVSANGHSRCIIDCQALGFGVSFERNESILSVLRGFTIRNAKVAGGAIRCTSTSPLIQACRLESNGLQNQLGGALYNLRASPTLENCIITKNNASYGAGLYNDASSPFLRNCTLADNAASSIGGAIYNADTNSRPMIINCIIWSNGSAPLAGSGIVCAQHSVIEGGSVVGQVAEGSDLGNSSADPKLTGAYYLKSSSPCIDAGMSPAPLRDIDGETRYDDPAIANGESSVDIGADEFVDTDRDGLADVWEKENFGVLSRDGTGDLDGDGVCDGDEYLRGCDPMKRDTDGDGMPDGWEIAQGFNPLDSSHALLDFDRDGLSDLGEFRAGADPKDSDSDKDGVSDFREVCWSRIASWGMNAYGQCTVPSSLTNAIAIAAGVSHTLALRSDGTLVVWGQNTYGQCTVPASATNIMAIAASAYNSLALRSDGVVIAWGDNSSGQCTVPTPASNAVALAAGSIHALALRSDGTVVAWGNNSYGQCTVPASATNVIAIAAGDYHSLALRADGSIVAWGDNAYQQCIVPTSAINVMAIAAGPMHNLAVRADGTVIAWGANNSFFDSRFRRWLGANNPYGQCTVPPTATNVMAVAVGASHSLALRRDGKVIAWGLNDVGQCSGASNVRCAASITSGRDHSIALSRMNPLKGDTDDDSLPDGWEVNYGLDPLDCADAGRDVDADGVTNLAEFTNKTNPCASDTDGDSLSDGWELAYGFNPLNPEDATLDMDGDGLSDGDECLYRTNPKVVDTDNDGMPDGWEVAHRFNPLNASDAGQDADGDGLTNLAEFTKKTNSRNADTDGDGIPDGWELAYGLNPLNPEDALLDLDKDGISNRKEYEMGSNPSAGYFLKETFDNGIPSDWTQQAYPNNQAQWKASWGSGGFEDIAGITSPYGGKGLNLHVYWQGEGNPVRLSTPWLNLGWNMTNSVLNFYYGNSSIYAEGMLIIYFRSQVLEGPAPVNEQEILCLEGNTFPGNFWKLCSVRLPNPRGNCQIVFEYRNLSCDSLRSVYVDEVSIQGDYGCASQDLSPLVIETASTLPSASRDIPYSTQLKVEGGLRPFLWRYQWSVVSNALPLGLALDQNTGVISGTLTNLGSYSFAVEARSEDGKAVTKQVELLVREPAVALSEQFDGGWIPQGWSVKGQNALNNWTAVLGVSPSGVSGLNACYKGDGSVSPQLVSPTIDLSKCNSNVVLRFWFRNPKNPWTGNRDYVLVYCQNGQKSVLLAASDAFDPHQPIDWQPIPDADGWREVVVVIPNLSAASQIIFKGVTTTSGLSPCQGTGFYLDDVRILADYGDTLFQAWMAQHFSDGARSGFYDDPDADGLTNLQEYQKGTDPKDSDTDDDGLKDGDEVSRGMNPALRDSDGDGLTDGEEVLLYGTNPLDSDTDHDGLWDGDELLQGTNPLKFDTDGDGMSDGWEVHNGYPPLLKNDPNKDSDGDGLSDGQEALAGTNPHEADTDRDGLTDFVEVSYGFDPTQFAAYVDSDNDGLPDKLEKAIGTDPNNWDSDGDNLADGWEFYGGLDPLSAAGNNGQGGDPDNDGLTNLDEYINGTSPTKADTDGDGTNDGTEVNQGSDPLDPSDNGQPPPGSELVEVPFSVGDPSGSHSERWQMNIKAKGPKDKRSFNFVNEAFGTVGTKTFKLRRGNSYEITLLHLATDPQYGTTDYDWQAQIGGLPSTLVLEGGKTPSDSDRYSSLSDLSILIDNQDGLLGTVDQSFETPDHTIGKKAMVHVVKAALVPDYDRDGDISEEKDYPKALSKTPLRFWVNDDKDVGPIASSDSDIPGQSNGNASDALVNGYSDLLDFTPVWFNISDVIALLSNELGISYYLSGRNVNFAYTSLMKNNAGTFLTKSGDADEILTKSVNTAYVTGTQIPASVINTIKSNPWKGVILIEGKEAGSTPLVLEVYKNSTLIFKCELPVQISPVEEMYTRVNLRSGTTISTSSNLPDSNGKNVIFVHGFSVDEQGARAANSEMFKRLYQCGSNAKFWGVTWSGDIGFLDGSVNYHGNVVSAFNTAKDLATVVNNNIAGDKIVMAHSLGNMVVSSAIQDQSMQVSKYFLLNAAVPAEAYDGTLFDKNAANALVHDDWKAYDSKTWTSCWHELFNATSDDRGKLTWENRFPAVAAVAYNYYSSGDEVFELFADRTPIVPDGTLSSWGRYSWHKQESFKGRVISNDNWTKLLHFPTAYSGWGFNSTWIWDPSTLDPFRKKYFCKYSADEANTFTSEALRITPVFNPEPSSMLNPTIPISVRNDILAKGIPALSPATGRILIPKLSSRNISMNALIRPNGWWRLDSGELNSRWLHSDLKDVAYFFVHPLFIDLCEKGTLK